MPLAPRKASNLAPYLWLISPSTDTSQVALPPNPQPPSRLPVIPAEAGIQTPVPIAPTRHSGYTSFSVPEFTGLKYGHIPDHPENPKIPKS